MSYRRRLYSSYVSANIEREVPITPSIMNHLALLYRKTVIEPFLPKDKQIRILDLGCGYGPFLYACAQAGYQNQAGVDASPEQVALAARLWGGKVIQSDIRDFLKGKNMCFDVITAFDVLEHFTKSEVLGVMDGIYNTLTPGGLFILRSPNGEGPFAGRYRYGDFTHELCFTHHSLMQLLETVGFTKVRCYEVEPLVHGVLSALRFSLWKLLRTALWFYQAVETGDYGNHYIFSQNILAVASKGETSILS
jgi:2-polyprenyl-3-methyl-5-hydroxy-6-metoxy-1,4-benzoquinol methylase